LSERKNGNLFDNEYWELQKKKSRLEAIEHSITSEGEKPHYIVKESLQEFEIANLVRLGLIKSIPQHYGFSSGKEIPNSKENSHLILEDLEIEISYQGDLLVVSELGRLLIEACSESNLIPKP
jgi:hypothetical protein